MGLNVVMQAADLKRTVITILENHNQTMPESVDITNSTYGQMIVTGKFEILISDCHLKSNLFNSTKPRLGFHLKIADSSLNIKNSDILLYNYFGFLQATRSKVSYDNVRFSKCSALYVILVSDGSQLHMDNVLFENLDCIKSQDIYVSVNSSAIINNCTFMNFYGTVACERYAEVTLSESYIEGMRPGTGLALRDSTASVTIENNQLNNVIISMIGGFVNVTRSTFTMAGTHPIFYDEDNSNIYVYDSVFTGGVVLIKSKAGNGHFFTNCKFNNNYIVANTWNSTVFITNSTVTNSQQDVEGAMFSLHNNGKLFMTDSIIAGNSPSSYDRGFLIAFDSSHICITRCLYTQNYFSPHFYIRQKSVLIIVDSQVNNNNGTFLRTLDASHICITRCLYTQNYFNPHFFIMQKSVLIIVDSQVNNNNGTFLRTLDASHICITRCLYTQNYFNPHFFIRQKSVLEIVDSQVNNNNGTSNLVDMMDGNLIIKRSQLHHNIFTLPSSILLYYSSLLLQDCSVRETVPDNNQSPWFAITAQATDKTIKDCNISATGDSYRFLYLPPFILRKSISYT